MTTLLHLYRARRLRQPPKHIRVLPAVSNEREVGEGGLTWPEIAVWAIVLAAACFVSWTEFLS